MPWYEDLRTTQGWGNNTTNWTDGPQVELVTPTTVVEYNYTYIFILTPIIILCLLSVLVNIVILSSLYWVRRPLNQTLQITLQISLSLALCDVFTLVTDSLGLTFNSLLPVGFAVQETLISECTALTIEVLRMGGRLTTVGHLLALTLNHYVGIRWPIQYATRMTSGNICILVTLLWIIPNAWLFLYLFSLEDDGFAVPGCSYMFLDTSAFRAKFSVVFFMSIIMMGGIYVHIYVLVKRHQDNRNRFRRAGSTYSRARPGLKEEITEKSNRKALNMTLIIVGSTVVGWFPSALNFALVCSDCAYNQYPALWVAYLVNGTCNYLLITKTAVNTYIYAARMTEIRKALKRMRVSLLRRCCKTGRPEVNGFSESRQSRASIMRRSQRTIHCRVQSVQRHCTNSTEL